MPFPLSILGVNHVGASGALRERLAGEEAEIPALLARLRHLGMTDGLWIGTCDRSEVWFVDPDSVPESAPPGGVPTLADRITAMLADRAGTPVDDLEAEMVHLHGRHALRHICAVAASLESRVVGEPHVLGQVREAHRLAMAAGVCGPGIEDALRAAYGVAKRVRSETELAEGATSIVAAALRVARDVHGRLDRCAALLCGVGDMGVMVAEGFIAAGLTRVSVTAPVERRALAAARRLNAARVGWEDMAVAMERADIVVTAVGQGHLVVGEEMMRAVLRRRRHRPVFIIDAAVPSDVAPAVGELDDAFLYDLNDLEGVVLAGRAGREVARRAAWALVEEAVEAYARDRMARASSSLVVALRGRFEAERARVLAENPGSDAETATRLLINRLLHHPSIVLRGASGNDGPDPMATALVTRLFDLNGEEEG